MSSFWCIFDGPGAWIMRRLTVKWVRRISVLMLYIAIFFYGYAPFSGEKQGVYQMSAHSLSFAAVIALIETKRMEDNENSS